MTRFARPFGGALKCVSRKQLAEPVFIAASPMLFVQNLESKDIAFMTLPRLLPLSLALLLAGCGAYSDFKLNNAVQDYKQTCFGQFTNSCESKLVDTNILMLESLRSHLSDEKDELTQAFGDDGYERFLNIGNGLIDKRIEQQESLRPGWFSRWFLGEGQPMRGNRNTLLNAGDMVEFREALIQAFAAQLKASGNAPRTAEETPVPAVVPEAPAIETNAVALNNLPALEAAIEARVASEIQEDGGAEYQDAREVLAADLNGDGHADALVLYSIEGQGGSNRAYQTLAAFYASPEGYSYQGSTVVSGSASDIKAIGANLFSLSTLTLGDDDPMCCPSVESIVKYRWESGSFTELPDDSVATQ